MWTRVFLILSHAINQHPSNLIIHAPPSCPSIHPIHASIHSLSSQVTRTLTLSALPLAAHALTLTRTRMQTTAPIGNALLELNDACVAAETCEELFTPDSPHILQVQKSGSYLLFVVCCSLFVCYVFVVFLQPDNGFVHVAA
jgi:hypothetical protein